MKKDYFDLTGQVAVVTGASSGLGVQFAKALANQGADLALCARRFERLEEVKKEIEALGVKVFIKACDVTQVNEVKDFVAAVEKEYGKIDILVNNAGVGGATGALETTDEDWHKTIDINLNAVYFMAREVGKVMIKKNYGRIINLGSIHSVVAMHPDTWSVPAYAASKGGVKMLTKAMAAELGRHGITVNAIGPGYFGSEMTAEILDSGGFDAVAKAYSPMNRPGREGELDTTLLYFASPASSYTNGQLIVVDGGWTTI